MALAHPSVRTSWVHWPRDTGHHGTGVLGGVCWPPGNSPHQWQEEYMMELWQELSWCMARVGLREGLAPARLTSHHWRCCHGCSSLWTQSTSAGPWGPEVAKHLRDDSSVRQSQSRGQHPQSEHKSNTHRSELWWCWSPSPSESWIKTSPSRPIRNSFPSPSPPHSHPTDEQLNCSLSDLHLHPQQWESRSLMQRGGTPTYTKGHPSSLQKPVAECPSLGLV